jgi:hypothetical protein
MRVAVILSVLGVAFQAQAVESVSGISRILDGDTVTN